VLHGLVCDLTDAHAEYVPELDVALSPEDVVADVWIVAAGVTMPAQGGQVVDRQTLARGNAPGFSAYGKSLARHCRARNLS
jgi:malate dehydrogenase